MRPGLRRVGFMQGRLSPPVDGKIQAFPWACWQTEFATAAALGLGSMEWTIDQERIDQNPLMTVAGRSAIRRLSAEHGVAVRSLTGDCFMQAPFWKAKGPARGDLIATFERLLGAAAEVGIRVIVVPLVDNGAPTSDTEREVLETIMLDVLPLLRAHDQVVAFECDVSPARQAAFIDGLPADRFGINFDMGNSASLGWDPEEEIPLLAPRIVNVHVKDRVRGGGTVPLGQGATDLPKVFAQLNAAGYRGDCILQTARAGDGDHAGVLGRYAAFVAERIG